MSKSVTFVHTDGSRTTLTAPLGGSIKVTTDNGVTCAKSVSFMGTPKDQICMGTPTPVTHKPASTSKGGGGCGCP
jgi:hypothetical protein